MPPPGCSRCRRPCWPWPSCCCRCCSCSCHGHGRGHCPCRAGSGALRWGWGGRGGVGQGGRACVGKGWAPGRRACGPAAAQPRSSNAHTRRQCRSAHDSAPFPSWRRASASAALCAAATVVAGAGPSRVPAGRIARGPVRRAFQIVLGHWDAFYWAQRHLPFAISAERKLAAASAACSFPACSAVCGGSIQSQIRKHIRGCVSAPPAAAPSSSIARLGRVDRMTHTHASARPAPPRRATAAARALTPRAAV